MKITVVTVWYNEAILAPFFLTLYNYADKIHIFMDADTDDNSEEIARQYDNVDIERFAFPEHRFSGSFIMDIVNKFVLELKSDWVYVVSADEFIFPRNGESARTVLARQSANLLYTQMGQTWRHRTETDLDFSKPSVYQRRHGQLLAGTRMGQWYNKPIIMKPESELQWKPGTHTYHRKNKKIITSKESFMGSHWHYADIARTIPKRIDELKRVVWKENIDYEKEKKKMIRIAETHLNDPQLF